MRLIIPMAGIGKRMRPHTLSTPKPLLPVAGKSIVQRLVKNISKVTSIPISEIGFVIGNFGSQVENQLKQIARQLNMKPFIYYQKEALGTAHAVFCAYPMLEGEVVIAFADTLFISNFNMSLEGDGTIWVHQVQDPSSYGVVQTNENGFVTDFIEKPKSTTSTNAIIGVYYLKNGEYLAKEIQYLLDHNIVGNGEYQLTDALKRLCEGGNVFTAQHVDTWLDCGNKDEIIRTNSHILTEEFQQKDLISSNVKRENSIIIPPCYVGPECKITDSIIGPYVSIEEGCEITRSIIRDSIVQNNTLLKQVNLQQSMVGKFVTLSNSLHEINIGDFSTSKYRIS